MKNNNTIFWIIGIIVLVFLILPKLQIQEQEEFTTIKVHYYDKYGNEIFSQTPTGTFSIVPSTSETNPNIETIDPSLADDIGTEGQYAPDNRRRSNVGGERVRVILSEGESTKKDIDYPKPSILDTLKTLIFQIGIFGLTTNTVTIEASNTDTYCQNWDTNQGTWWNYDADILQGIGSEWFIHPEFTVTWKCHGLMQFPVTSLPSDLTSADQITSVILHYRTKYIQSDEGDGVQTVFALFPNLESYDWTPNDDNEISMIWNRIFDMWLTGGEFNEYYLTSHKFFESEEGKWFSREIGTTIVKNEIIANKDGSPDNVLAIGVFGEMDMDNEYVTFNWDYEPYIVITYTSGVEEAVDISFEVTAMNSPLAEINYIGVSITDATPIELKNALPTTTYDLPIGSSQTWYSENIIIKEEWKGTTQTFEVWVSGTNEYTDLIETKYASTDLIL